ncbi:hypothetical protein D3C84_1008970 [compost metagenome]
MAETIPRRRYDESYGSGSTFRSDGDGGQRSSGAELGSVDWCDELHGEARDDERRPLHERGDERHDDELYEHELNERHDVLLCCQCNE